MFAHPCSAAQNLVSGAHGICRNRSGLLREQGTALVFALVMLLILTILGITAITTSSLQEKMAGNMRDQYMAQQAADSIVLDGISWIFNQQFKPIIDCPPTSGSTGNIWNSDCMPAAVGGSAGYNWWLTADDSWWSGNGLVSSVPTNTSFGYVAQEPRYVMEKIRQVEDVAELGKPKKYTFYFRTTGWAVGASEYARNLVQSIFTKRSDTYQNN